MNYRLLIQYDGTDFHGWQMQGDLRTVQGELTRVLSLLDDGDVVVHGSGRTDAGVHAEGQVASAKLQTEFAPVKLRNAINSLDGLGMLEVKGFGLVPAAVAWQTETR